jgi:hypothetical protein
VSCRRNACRLKEKAFEAQLDTARYKKSFRLEIEGPNVWYLGLFRVEPATVEQLRIAQDRATRTVDRARVKLLEGLLSEENMQKELYVRQPFLVLLIVCICCIVAQ